MHTSSAEANSCGSAHLNRADFSNTDFSYLAQSRFSLHGLTNGPCWSEPCSCSNRPPTQQISSVAGSPFTQATGVYWTAEHTRGLRGESFFPGWRTAVLLQRAGSILGGKRRVEDSQAHFCQALRLKPIRLCGNESCSRSTCMRTAL